MLPKRLLAIILGTALAAMGGHVAQAQWVRMTGPYSQNTIEFAVVDGFIYASNYIYAYNGGTFRSSDTGLSWLSPAMPMLGWTQLESTAGKIFAVQARQPYLNDFSMSSDSGATWKGVNGFPIFNGPFGSPDTSWFTNFCVSTDAIFIELIDQEHSDASGLYRSTDSGSSWNWIANSTKPTSLVAAGKLMLAEGLGDRWMRSLDDAGNWDTTSLDTIQYLNVVNLVENDSGFFIGTNRGVFFSSDTGLGWEPRNRGLNSFNVTQIANSGDTLAVATADSGVFISKNNGESWVAMNSGLTTKQVSNIAFLSKGLIACDSIFESAKHLFRIASFDSDWQPLYCPWGDVGITCLMADSNKMFAGGPGGIYFSTDSGKTWYPEKNWNTDTPIFTVNLEGYPSVNALACIKGIYYLGSGSGGIYRSTDRGASWLNVQAEGNGPSDNFNFVYLGGILFANDYSGLLMSSDTGKTWTNLGRHLPYLGVGSLDTIHDALIYGTCCDTGLFQSTDGGINWSTLGSHPWWSVQAIATVDGDIFVSDINNYWNYQTDFYLSTDGGSQWNSIIDGFWGLTASEIVSAYGYLFACGPGIFRRPLSDFGISAVSEPRQPSTVTIRAYPNPFTQSTTISFLSDAVGYAEVSVVNALGVEVARLFSGELAPGEHRFTWSNPTLPDGMYECVIHMNGQVSKAGLVLMH